MKKFYLFIAFLILSSAVYSQSPRLILVEEFTGETCGPCATNNPGFNAILNAYPQIVISLKYQNNIPSAGPNFYAYNTADVSNRTTYYANNYSPHAFLDGNVWNGNAASLTAAMLTNRSVVQSPFEINVEQSFSVNHDIVYVHAVIRATQAVSSSNLKARIAISERDIYGYTSPNGESDYQHVMRKLLPTGTGTALPATWAIGDSVVLDQSWTITVPTNPSIFMPAWARLESIVWVQDDNTKEIKQTGYDTGPAVPYDPSLTLINGVTPITCSGSVTPTVVATNYEPTAVTSMDIEYYLDSQTPSTYSWSGSLPQNGTANITLPSVAITTPGVHTITANIVTANGSPDIVTTNNTISKTAGVPYPGSTVLTESFPSAGPFPPADWILQNNDNAAGWGYSTGGIGGPGSAKINFYESPAGQIDIMYTIKTADLTNAVSPTLTFSIAHAMYSATYHDKLDIIVSNDCGVTWNSVWNKIDPALSTVAAYVTSAYNSPSAAHWRLETADLSAYAGQNDVLIAIKATSGFGNNLHIDNINLNTTVGINEHAQADISLFPVPSNGLVSLNVGKVKADDMNITVTGISGNVVRQFNLTRATDEIQLDLSELESGSYFIHFTAGDESSVKKIMIEK